jgi:hypothetical protein
MPEIQSNPEFYSPWPLLGKRLNFQWGNIRQDIGVLKAIARAQVQDVETGDDFINADRILTGLEFGELVTNTASFKNRFRLFYDKVLDKFCIQYNDNTEASPNWIDYLCIDQSSGLVTVTGLDVGELGIDTSGGFYGVNGYVHFQGSPNAEWVVPHNLDTPHLIVQTYNDHDRIIQFDEADTSDPNTAYFYFVTPQSGKAVLFGHGFVDRTMHVSESDGNPDPFNTSNIIFDSEFFYLSSNSTSDPVVSLRGAALGGEINTASNLGAGATVFAQKAGVDLQFKSLTAGSNIVLTPSSTEIEITAIADKFYGITVKHSNDTESFSGINVVTFNSNDFYITQNSPNTDEVIVNFRGSAGSGGISNITVRESDLTPPDFATDTVIFDSSYFYLHPTSTDKPSVAIREDNILVSHRADFDIHRHVSGFYANRDPDDGSITRINWKNGDYSIVNRNPQNLITSIVGRYYRKTFTRDTNDLIVEVNYERIN